MMGHRIIRENVSEGEKKNEREKRNARERTYPEVVTLSLLLLLLLRHFAHAQPTHLEGKENGISFGA
jgi:hypothetical protein